MRLHKAVRVRPSVKAHAEAVALKDAVHLAKGGLEPRVIVVAFLLLRLNAALTNAKDKAALAA